MSYQVDSAFTSEWGKANPTDELKVLLDEYPNGVSLTGSDGSVTNWRKTPRDEELVAEIADAININPRNQAERVYDLLERRGVL